MSCRIKDKSLYALPGNSHLLHLGTISRGFQDFVVMLCVRGPHSGKCYIEELVPMMKSGADDVWGNFKFVEDDALAQELADFAERQGLTNIQERIGELYETGLVFRA